MIVLWPPTLRRPDGPERYPSISDKGNTWKRKRDLTPDRTMYPGWKFNNIQPVTRPDGSTVDGMLLFYGWKDKDAPEARAFLLNETAGLASNRTISARR